MKTFFSGFNLAIGFCLGFTVCIWLVILTPYSIYSFTDNYHKAYKVGQNHATKKDAGWKSNPFNHSTPAYYGWEDGFQDKREELILGE